MSPRKPTRAVQLGVTDDDYARMLAAQDGHCALCPAVPKTRRFSVDHDHATGAVRGLLCHRCNRALPTWITAAWLHRAADYLESDVNPGDYSVDVRNPPPGWTTATRRIGTLDNSPAVVLAPPPTTDAPDLTTEG